MRSESFATSSNALPEQHPRENRPSRSGVRGLRRWLFELRGRLHRQIATPEFQRRAAAWLPGAWIARREARYLFDLTAGFTYSQVLLACEELQLLQRVAEGSVSLRTLARDCGVDAARLERLVDAAAALKLLMVEDQQVGLGRAGAGLLGNAGAMAMIRHHPLLYADLADPVALIGKEGGDVPITQLGRFWPYCRGADGLAPSIGAPSIGAPSTGAPFIDVTEDVADDPFDYSALMASSQSFINEQTLSAYAFDRHRQVLDLGGGTGRFGRALLERYPELNVTVLDLPTVVAEAAPAERLTFAGGDFLTGPLPKGADLISLVRVLHDHDDGAVRSILRNAEAALAPGGRVLVAEPMRGNDGVDAYFACYFLAMGQGRLRSAGNIRQLLKDAGFRSVREHRSRLPLLSRILVAER
ncbi:MAG: methyltransferase [Pseudomonadota bacterium]